MTSNASPAPDPSGHVHVVAAMVAIGVIVAAAVGGTWWGKRVERKTFLALLPLFSEAKEHAEVERGGAYSIEHLKNQGTALQRLAFTRTDVLPLYGSSELVKRIPDKASLFFRHLPTGFTVFPVGKAGTSSLIILEKIAALGAVTNGKRVAISLSPSWFFSEAPPEHPYNGNFSRQQAFSALLNPQLSFSFKRDLARRMAMHPLALESDTLLRFLTHRIARGGRLDRVLYGGVWPLAHIQQALYSAQDHFENALFVNLHRVRPWDAPAAMPTQLDWEQLLAEASARPSPQNEDGSPSFGSGRRIGTDAAFRDKLANAPEWDDLTLLLRGLHELGLRTLVLCMPPNGIYLEHGGISKESLDLFAGQIRTIAARSGAQVEAFEDHEEDVNFLVDHHDHMSAKGWMYYNRALDEFFHTAPEQLERQFARGHRKHLRPSIVERQS